MRRMLWVALVFVGGAACSSPRLIGEGPFLQHDPGPGGPDRGGMRYYVGKDVLLLTGTRTIRTDAAVDEQNRLVQRTTETSVGSLGLQTIPDTRQVFRLDLQPSASSDDTLEVKLRGGGILESINVSGESKAGAILKNVTSFVGTVVGMAAGGRSVSPMAAARAPVPEDGEPDPLAAAKREPDTRRTVDWLADEVLRKLLAYAPTSPEAESARHIVKSRIARIDDVHRFVLAASDHARALLAQGLFREALIVTRQQERIEVQRRIAAATNSVDVKILSDKLKVFESSLVTLGKERTAAYAAFEIEMGRFVSERGAPREVQQVPFSRYMELSDLPTAEWIQGAHRGARTLEARAVVERLRNYGAARRVFDETGVLVTLSAAPAGFFDRDLGASPACSDAPAGTAGPGRNAPGRVFYRQSYPAILQVWVRTREEAERPGRASFGDLGSVSLSDEQLVEVMHPHARLEYLQFDPQAFAQHKLGLSFDESSRLLSVTRESTSSLEGVTGAALDAAQGYRDELAQTLQTVTKIQASRRAIALDPLTTEVAMLELRKEAIDGRIALEGATASEELLREKARIDNELALAQSRQALAQIQGSEGLDEELSRLRIELEALRAEVEALRRK